MNNRSNKVSFTIMIILTSFLTCGSVVAAESISSVSANDLIENALKYDQEIVELTGEVIGDVMQRGSHSWINILTYDGMVMGIWASNEMLDDKKILGGYDARGDRMMVIGSFFRACPEHGGDMDIHASEIIVIEKGFPISHPVKRNKVIAAVVLFTAAMTLAFALIKNGRRSSWRLVPSSS